MWFKWADMEKVTSRHWVRINWDGKTYVGRDITVSPEGPFLLDLRGQAGIVAIGGNPEKVRATAHVWSGSI